MAKPLESSPNALINKSVYDRYADLSCGGGVIATYVWIDGTGEDIRAKDRTLDAVPKSPKGLKLN